MTALRIRQIRHKQPWEKCCQGLGMMIAMRPTMLPTPICNRHLKKTESVVIFLWQLCSTDWGRPRRCEVVNSRSLALAVSSTCMQKMEFDHRIQCLQESLGCQLPWEEHKGWSTAAVLKHTSYLEMKADCMIGRSSVLVSISETSQQSCFEQDMR